MKSYWITYFYVVISSVVISGFRHEVYENCALLSYYAASSGNLFPTFRDNLSVPSAGVEKSFWIQIK